MKKSSWLPVWSNVQAYKDTRETPWCLPCRGVRSSSDGAAEGAVGEGVRRLHRILGRVEAERQRSVDGRGDARPGRLRDGLLAAHVRPHQVRDGVVRVVLQLVLYPFVYSVRLNHRLGEKEKLQ